jgi:hypothetical protein
MATTREQRGTASQRLRRKLQQQIGLGRTALLLVLLVSLLNQLLLLLKVNFHFLFSASVPYYLNWLARKLGGPAGATPLKVIAVIVTLLIYFVYVACWLFSARRREFLKTALLLYCADTVLLVIFACALLNNPFNCLLEVLTHLIVIAVLYMAHRAAQQLRRMPKKRKPRPEPLPEENY